MEKQKPKQNKTKPRPPSLYTNEIKSEGEGGVHVGVTPSLPPLRVLFSLFLGLSCCMCVMLFSLFLCSWFCGLGCVVCVFAVCCFCFGLCFVLLFRLLWLFRVYWFVCVFVSYWVCCLVGGVVLLPAENWLLVCSAESRGPRFGVSSFCVVIWWGCFWLCCIICLVDCVVILPKSCSFVV